MKTNNPSWWNEQHDSAWDRVKAALKRDWEQTKADVSSKGHELDQSVSDTINQAAGNQPIPPGNVPNKPESWDDAETGFRYGTGARSQYGKDNQDWDDRLEAKLSEEWKDLKSGRTWDEAKGWVRRAWDRKD